MKGKSASFVKHTEIDVTGTPLAGNFTAGQAFGVIAPGEDENGKPHKVRLYSFACPSGGEDGTGNIISTTPKRVIDEHDPRFATRASRDHALFLGVCSNYLCGLAAGDEVQLTGPSGKRFLLPQRPGEHDYLFIATGTGIAPIRGMLMELFALPGGACESRIDLVMGVPYTSDLLYDEWFQELATKHDTFHYHTAISREPMPGRDRGMYVDELIDTSMDSFAPMLANERTLIYMCGLTGMQTGIYRLLARHRLASRYLTVKEGSDVMALSGWDDAQIKRSVRSTERCLVEVY